MSCLASALTAACCAGESVPLKDAVIAFPSLRVSVNFGLTPAAFQLVDDARQAASREQQAVSELFVAGDHPRGFVG